VRADLLAGRIQIMFDNVAVMLPYVQRGELRGLAVTSPKRRALVPDLPTLRELDLAAAEIEGWFIVLGPAGVPDAVVQRLNTAITRCWRRLPRQSDWRHSAPSRWSARRRTSPRSSATTASAGAR
jgi:tripartite-type tricarboxylate transporter receptor subunit TctC